MDIRQRLVRFGTAFGAHEAEDRREEGRPHASFLCRNEIAVDVGSTCWGWLPAGAAAPEILRVIDHHFDRPGQFPSASAAVLSLDSKIQEWGAALPHTLPEIWIATHQQPDFDALCAVTLVEDILLHGAARGGTHPGNWFQPELGRIAAEHRWRYQLAAVASISDQCKRSPVPRNRTLPAWFHACEARGAAVETGEFRRRFFGIIRRELNHGRNALTDSVLEFAEEFQLEREFLDRQDEAYTRDLRRARRTIVGIPVDPAFDGRYAELCARPLLDDQGAARPEHLLPGGASGGASEGASVVVDGVFLRDPECLLFKQFARQDADNCPSGHGFVFTAVVYSQDKKHPLNRGDYFFALNPEAIPGAHLYPVWALLEAAEVRARVAAKQPEAGARREFAGRAAGRWSGHFNDPWFDGGAYKGTIVVTPGDGTWIGPAGEQSDLADDPVVRLVTDYFESVLWAGEQRIEDFAASPAAAASQAQTGQVLTAPRPLVDQAFRFAAVALREGTDLFRENLGYDVGRRLWQTLAPGTSGVPLDFHERHLVVQRASAGCWNRNGVALAYLDNPEGRRVRERLSKMVESMASLAREISAVVAAELRDVGRLRGLLNQVADLKWQAAQPDVKLAQRFFDAIGFEREMSLVHDLYHAEVSRNTLRDIASLQRSAGVLEVMVLGVYALEGAHMLASGALETHFAWALAYLIGAPLAIGGAVAWLHMRGHREEAGDSTGGRHLVLIGALFVLLLGIGAWLATVSHRTAEEEAQRQQEQRDRAAAAERQRENVQERQWRDRVEEVQRELERIGRPASPAAPAKPAPRGRVPQ